MRGAFSFRAALAAVGGSVYAFDDIGVCIGSTPEPGTRRGTTSSPPTPRGARPWWSIQTVYVGLDDGLIAAVDADTGHLVWRTLAGGAVGALAPSGERIWPRWRGRERHRLRPRPRGTLIDEPSPTELDLPIALANFAGAFLLMTACCSVCSGSSCAHGGPGKDRGSAT